MAELHRFSVSGMHCAGCAAAVERAVRRLPGPEEIYVNFATGRLSLRPTEGYPGDEAVTAAVNQSGFRAEVLSDRETPAPDAAEGRGEWIRLLVCAVFTAALIVA